jgi:hypothetical protein
MTDNMPDFDKMSPEELMAWMESLAKRQGAAEGFTTSADVDVPEIDPTSVEIDEPGYIPYGMDTEKWEAKKAEEDRIKAERLAQQRADKAAAAAPPTPPAPVPPPVEVPAPVPVPEPAAAGMTDFDSMSPDELMKWMESLAKRQGADEGFTTSADAQVPEIDPGTVHIDEPGYIPYGMDADTWARKQADEQARKAARRAPSEPVMPPAEIQPSTLKPVPEPEPDVIEAGEEFALDLDFDLEATAKTPARNAQDALAWLESLAAEAGTIPGVDLGSLEAFNAPPVAPVPQEDPLAWLESLSQAQTGIPGLEGLSALDAEEAIPAPPPAVSATPPSDNPLEWLESLARRQGAADEELITEANLDVPVPETTAPSGPGYTDFSVDRFDVGVMPVDKSDSFDSEEIQFDIDAMDENIDDWLSAIASGQIDESADADEDIAAIMQQASDDFDEADEEPSTADIMSALKQGQDVSPDVMSTWMSSMLDAGARRTDVPDYIDSDEDEDEAAAAGEIEAAELPDWLLQQVGAPPPVDTAPTPDEEAEALEVLAEIEAGVLPSDVEMPDWLRESLDDDADSAQEDLQRIFADELEALAEPEVLDEDVEVVTATQRVDTAELQVDTSDPWVAAFEEERRQGDAVPAWYLERLQAIDGGDGEEFAVEADGLAVEDAGAVVVLTAATLPPERELSAGELMAVPEWLDVDAEAEPVGGEEEAYSEFEDAGTPDFAAFMRDVENEEEPALSMGELPDWLREQTADEDEVVAPLEALAETGDDLPEWLKEAGISGEVAAAVPDWLIESLGEDSQEVREVAYISQLAVPEPAPVVVPPAPAPQSSPAPIIPAAASIDVGAALQEARSKVQAGDIEVSLQNYEAVVRANQQLDEVVKDLSSLLDQEVHKKNPTVYRVLGDGLMRQGNLQAALDTYRRALNLL